MQDKTDVKFKLKPELWDASQEKAQRYIDFFICANKDPNSKDTQNCMQCLYDHTKKYWKNKDLLERMPYWKAAIHLKIREFQRSP